MINCRVSFLGIGHVTRLLLAKQDLRSVSDLMRFSWVPQPVHPALRVVPYQIHFLGPSYKLAQPGSRFYMQSEPHSWMCSIAPSVLPSHTSSGALPPSTSVRVRFLHIDDDLEHLAPQRARKVRCNKHTLAWSADDGANPTFGVGVLLLHIGGIGFNFHFGELTQRFPLNSPPPSQCAVPALSPEGTATSWISVWSASIVSSIILFLWRIRISCGRGRQ